LFQQGNKFGKGGKRKGAGQPKLIEKFTLETQLNAFRKEALRDGGALGRFARSRAFKSDQILGKYLDAVLKQNDTEEDSRPLAIQINLNGPGTDSTAQSQGHSVQIRHGGDDSGND
jgi:hypothetical protein